MSRCFPFPPPGYEKKPITDDADLLKKEKHKEKRHKKEKKDKEKREGKEKREKDRNDGKHREKKDKKEKHKDKRKEKKDRGKDKEKGGCTEEKRFPGLLEANNGEKLHQGEKKQGNEKSSTSNEKRDAGKFDSCYGEKIHQKMERSKDRSSSVEEKPPVQFHGHNGMPAQNIILDKETENSKFVLEFNRRNRDEEKGTGRQLVVGFEGMDWEKDEGAVRCAVRGNSVVVEDKTNNKDRKVDNRKIDGQAIVLEEKFSTSVTAQSLSRSIQNKAYGVPLPMEKSDGRIKGKEKSNDREGDDKRGKKRKSKDKEKQSKVKDKKKGKVKKKDEKAKEKKEHKKSENEKIKHSNKNDLIGVLNNNSSHLFKDGDLNAATEGKLKKRKDTQKNGFLHDNELRPEKMPRPTSHFLSNNGTKFEPSQTPIPFALDRQGTADLKSDNKDCKMNGLIGAQPLPVSVLKPSSLIAEQTAEGTRRPPHPDSKFLSKVLLVPQMGEWSDFDDQEWLFSREDCALEKPRVGSVVVNEEQQVWAEALLIESGDVCALPYVIPF